MDSDQITNALENTTRWTIAENKLVAEYSLDNFDKALEFFNQVAQIAIKHDHHPLMTLEYSKLTIETTTHDAGNTITELDIETANAIELAFRATS